jgi:tryptophanase
MEYIAAALQKIYTSRHEAKHGYNILWEAPIMRHFTVRLEKIQD